MPAMPRSKSKATKVAYAILGKPANLQPQKEKERKKDKETLDQFNTGYTYHRYGSGT
jgi:hypothetical protein